MPSRMLSSKASRIRRWPSSGAPLKRLRPAAEPAARRAALRQRELVDQRAHLLGQDGDTFGVAQAHLDQRLPPGGVEARHRMAQLACALARTLRMRAGPARTGRGARTRWPACPSSVTCGSATKIAVGRVVERLGDRQAALDPCERRLRPALHVVHLTVHDARHQHQRRSRSTPTRALRRAAPPPAPAHTRRAGSARSRSRAAGARASRARACPAAACKHARRRFWLRCRRPAIGRRPRRATWRSRSRARCALPPAAPAAAAPRRARYGSGTTPG